MVTDRRTDRQTDRQTDIATYRAAITAKKVNFGTLVQKGGGGQSKILNVDQ